MGIFTDFLNGYKGTKGETKIEVKLDNLDFFGYHGKCLRNLYVPRYDGSTTEIDLVYITRKGIFIIESKNYVGYIFGSDKVENWTCTLYGGKTWYGSKKVEKRHFYNPVRQNYAHLKALTEYLGELYSFSLIVFGDKSELRDITITTPGIYVCNTSTLGKVIKDIWNREPDIYTEDQVKDIQSKLTILTNVSSSAKRQHIQSIGNDNQLDICPWCGGKLVLREAKQGKYKGNSFYGCSNYPRCKYIRNN